MPHTVQLPNGYTITDDRTRLDMAYVLASLATTYWAHDRPKHVTERSWANCLAVGIYAPTGKQAGFARILTDYALRAHVGDVFVQPEARGQGLAKALVEMILAHPGLATVGAWTLTTTGAHSLYARYGFRAAEADGNWMTLTR